MAEEQKEPQQVTTKEPQVMEEPQRVTTKSPKKVEAGKRLAESNRRRKEAKKREEQVEKSGVNRYYGIGAVIALGVIGGLGHYIYRTKKGEVKDSSTMCNPTVPQQPSANKFEMD